MTQKIFSKHFSKINLIWIFLAGLFIFTRFVNLDQLPVFADESIYIRWAQLIIDDWQRYLFFPLNDGKTPIFVWMMVPFQFLFSDQLVAGRVVSALVGILQVLIIIKILKLLTTNKITHALGGILAIVLPFWFFYQRMALMDGLLTLFSSLSVWAMIKSNLEKSNKWAVGSGLFLGCAILTKIPALFLLPILPLITFLNSKHILKNIGNKFTRASVAGITGLGVFGLLKINPAFGQLFNRGGDFIYSFSQLMEINLFGHLWRNSITQIGYLTHYLTWPVMFAAIYGIFLSKTRRFNVVLLVSALFFAAPLIILGKVVYPRYLLPCAIFITLAAALTLGEIFRLSKKMQLKKQALCVVGILLLFVSSFDFSSKFILTSLYSSNSTSFNMADRVQYLTEWSSGHGIKKTTTYIQQQAKDHSILVLTEGYFGTLPDGILMYLHRRDVSNIFVTGIGQPIREVSSEMKQKAHDFDQTIVVVNSHRNFFNKDDAHLIARYCRPYSAPCLELWDLTDQLQPD